MLKAIQEVAGQVGEIERRAGIARRHLNAALAARTVEEAKVAFAAALEYLEGFPIQGVAVPESVDAEKVRNDARRLREAREAAVEDVAEPKPDEKEPSR